MRRDSRADANQAGIVRELRARGISVCDLRPVGEGCPDIMVGWQGGNYLFEIKNPDRPPSARKLTESEQRFHDAWRGQVTVVETVEHILELLETG